MPRLTGAALALLVLTACAAPVTGFRDPAAPVYSIAAFDPARLPGTWTEAAAFRPAGAPPCAPGQAAIAPDLTTRLRLCAAGAAAAGRLVPAGPGRLQLAGAPSPLDQPIWVIWVDTDYRTLALGTPSGAWGAILVRGAPLSGDRLRAAAEVFDFSGYDTARLRRLP